MTSQYLLRRFGHSIGVLFVVALIMFLLLHLVPGDPVRIALGTKAPQATVEQVRHSLGYDRPLVLQFTSFLSGLFRGDLGYSIEQHTSVASLIGPRIAASLLLLAYAILVSILLALPLGILSALRRDRLLDHLIRIATMVTFAMPSFWLGLVLVEIVSLRLHLLPVSGYEGGLWSQLKDLTLPAVTIGLYLAPMLIRTLRGSIIDVLGSDFVEAARARGFSEARVITRHVLRNASIATIMVLAIDFGFLISGTVVVEVVYAIPGLGSLIVNAIQTRDFPLVQALTVFFAGLVIVANFLADLAHVVIDPRVRGAH